MLKARDPESQDPPISIAQGGMSWLKSCTSRGLAVWCDGCSAGGQCTKINAAPASSVRASRRQTTAAEAFTPDLNASEQKRMSGRQYTDGGLKKKSKLSPDKIDATATKVAGAKLSTIARFMLLMTVVTFGRQQNMAALRDRNAVMEEKTQVEAQHAMRMKAETAVP